MAFLNTLSKVPSCPTPQKTVHPNPLWFSPQHLAPSEDIWFINCLLLYNCVSLLEREFHRLRDSSCLPVTVSPSSNKGAWKTPVEWMNEWQAWCQMSFISCLTVLPTILWVRDLFSPPFYQWGNWETEYTNGRWPDPICQQNSDSQPLLLLVWDTKPHLLQQLAPNSQDWPITASFPNFCSCLQLGTNQRKPNILP